MSSSSCRSVSTNFSLSRPAGPLQLVGGGFLENLFHRSDPALQLLEPVAPERQHAFPNRGLLDLTRGAPLQHQIPELRGHVHDLVHALPSPIAGVAALHAALALHEGGS